MWLQKARNENTSTEAKKRKDCFSLWQEGTDEVAGYKEQSKKGNNGGRNKGYGE